MSIEFTICNHITFYIMITISFITKFFYLFFVIFFVKKIISLIYNFQEIETF